MIKIVRKYFVFLLVFLLVPQLVLALASNDQYFSQQWYLQKINAPRAWDYSIGASSIVVAVLDSGVDLDHPDLRDNIWINQKEIGGDGIDNDNNGYIDDIKGWNFVEKNNNPTPVVTGLFTTEGANHGTVMAGVVSGVGNNYQGIAGINWRTKIMPLRVLDSTGEGNTTTVTNAIEYAIDNGADVINLSFVGVGRDPSLANAIKRAYERNIVVVAAAGNTKDQIGGVNLDSSPMYPVCDDGGGAKNYILGVAALDQDDVKARFSNFGAACVDVSAPGVNFFSTRLEISGDENFKYAYSDGWEGTSLAAPLVAGLAALLKAMDSSFTNHQIYNFIIDNTDPVDNSNPDHRGQLGSGRINASSTVLAARAVPTTATSPTTTTLPPVSVVPTIDSSGAATIITAPWTGLAPEIRTHDSTGSQKGSFLAYASGFTGGVNIASGDVDGDGQVEIITAAGKGGGPHVRVFDTSGRNKTNFFAFETSFRGGVNVVVADLSGDGQEEIIVAPLSGKTPLVRVYDYKGILIDEFLAYASGFTGGVNISAGDVDGDGQVEIITAAGKGGGPHVRVFDRVGNLEGQFFAYDPLFNGGVNLAVGDLDGDGQAEIITAPFSSGGPHVRIFNKSGQVKGQFFAFDSSYRGGVSTAVGDVDSNGTVEIVASAGPGHGPRLRVFDRIGSQLSEFYTFGQDFIGGVVVNILK